MKGQRGAKADRASAIRMFRDEFLVHVKEGGCPHG